MIDDDEGNRNLRNVCMKLPGNMASDLINQYLSSRQMMMMEAVVPSIISVYST